MFFQVNQTLICKSIVYAKKVFTQIISPNYQGLRVVHIKDINNNYNCSNISDSMRIGKATQLL